MEKIRKMAEFESTRDYLRHIVKIICERLKINNIDVYKLNSKEDCIKCIESIVKSYNNSQDNKAYIREIDQLKEELELIAGDNKKISEVLKNKEIKIKAQDEVISNFEREHSKLLKENIENAKKINKLKEMQDKNISDCLEAINIFNKYEERIDGIKTLKFKNSCLMVANILFLGLSLFLFLKV